MATSAPDDPGAHQRGAWNVYIETDDVLSLFIEVSRRPEIQVIRAPSPQPYGQIEFEVIHLNGYVLVFAQPIQATFY
jgi:hypothetical protein